MKRLLFYCSILLCLAFVAQSEIRHVPDEYETIQAGIDAAEEGDTVLVEPGEYVENIVIETAGITLASKIILDENNDFINSTIIDGGGNSSTITIAFRGNEPFNFRGFTIKNGNPRGLNCQIGRMFIEDMLITENGLSGAGGGLHAEAHESGGAWVILKRCRIDNNRAIMGGGISVLSARLEMENCVISNNLATASGNFGGGGIHTGPSMFGVAPHITIQRTLFINNRSERDFGAAQFYWGDVSLDHVTIVGNRTGQDFLHGGISFHNRHNYTHGTITNSIFFDNDGYEISVTDEGISISYSDLEGGRNGMQETRQNQIDWDVILDEDPLFADPDNGDYRLTADSPCIDAGDPDAELDPDGTRADIGAFYFHQRDIEVDNFELHFDPIPWESLDSQAVNITNTGGNDLHIIEFMVPNHPSFFYFREDPQPEIPFTIEPDSTYQWWIYFHPQIEGYGQAMLQSSYIIVTDDPDESEIEVIVDAEVLGVDNFILHPSSFILSTYPNPFNSSTTISFRVGANSNSPVQLSIYDLSGRLVQTLVNGTVPAGIHSVVWDASGVGAGVYFVRMEADPPQPPLSRGESKGGSIQKVVVIK